MRRTLFIPPQIERRVVKAALAVASTVLAPPHFVEDIHYRMVTRESGSERRDLPIWTTISDKARLISPNNFSDDAPPPSWGPVVKTDVPGAEGAFVLSHVLTEEECDAIVNISETMGYTPDAPVSLGRNIRRNDNCVIIADDGLWGPIWQRVEEHMPRNIMGGVPAGLNRRWRLYRYGTSDIFKMHTDGSWAGSGLDERGRLVHDIYGDRRSRLTFLIYLDDDYDGGETTFHIPGIDEDVPGEKGRGSLISVRVPKGSVLCFFHGEHPLSLLHEGSVVTRGVKRIVRTDVLYTLPGGGRGDEF